MTTATPDIKAVVAGHLDRARRRSLDLLDPLPDHDLTRQISPIMSPLVWDLAHVGNYEDLWLLRAAADAPGVDVNLDPLYDAFRHPRANRPSLPILGPPEARRYVAEVRDRVLDVLDRVELDAEIPLLGGAFVYGMVVQHEHQHDETMLATLQLLDGAGYQPVATPPPPGRPLTAREVLVGGGPFVMGTDSDPWAYDNERPAHTVDLPPFWIDAAPVTNARYMEFMADGGYSRPELWTPDGWTWSTGRAVTEPQFWHAQGDGTWWRNRFGWLEPVAADEPVQHVSWYEADAYARWAGRRLPTEAEWEKAASWGPDSAKRRWPWGDDDPTPEHANLGQRHFRPAGVGAYPRGLSPYGCHQMIGDVWEWTASDFGPYPGFRTFPYREYSEVFFDSGYKVLRGGSWAVDPVTVRTTFRNWDLPIRRQIFAGFRCARDADPGAGAAAGRRS